MESVQNDNGKFKPKRFGGKSKKSVPKLNFLIDQKKTFALSFMEFV